VFLLSWAPKDSRGGPPPARRTRPARWPPALRRAGRAGVTQPARPPPQNLILCQVRPASQVMNMRLP
jgi:hypothetical protein